MPLESLGQPFNPDEPGRKLREVQVEPEPEKESTAREQYDHAKKLFCNEGVWFSDYGKDVIHRHALSLTESCILSLVEQELEIPSYASEKYQEELRRHEDEVPLPNIFLVLHMLPKKPEYARMMWEKTITRYVYNKKEAQYFRIADTEAAIGTHQNMRLFFTLSCINAEEGRRKMVALIEKYGAEKKGINTWKSLGFHITSYDLISALVESSCDMPRAIEYHNALKDSSSWDPSNELWRILDQDLAGRQLYYLEDQLYDILYRIRLEKYQKSNRVLPPAQSIPEERNF